MIANTKRPQSPALEGTLDLYDQVISIGFSELLNDASLLLDKIFKHHGTSKCKLQRDTDALRKAAEATRDLANLCANEWEDYAWCRATRLKVKIVPAIKSLLTSIKGRKKTLKLDFEDARQIFLNLAVGVETTLGHIVSENEDYEAWERLGKVKSEVSELDSLANNFKGLKIKERKLNL